jgi:hypothetical protein
MASQTDVLRRQDVASFTMVEVSPEQAAAYLDAAVGRGTWDALPPALRALARNPQDLALIAEVAGRLGPDNLPSRRAALYAEKIEDDSALREWVATADPRLGLVYALAFRMLVERRLLDEPTLAEWVREALAARDLNTDEIGAVAAAVRRSRLFKEDAALDRLGRRHPVLAFDHELIGAFLAARHVRAALTGPERVKMLEFAERETWQNVFFFVVDEIESDQLNMLLDWLLGRGEGQVLCDTRGRPLRDTAGEALRDTGNQWTVRIVAYALATKPAEMIRGEVCQAYNRVKLRQDIQMTPAA